MKIAITGSSGLIGQALTASLRADGHEVVRLVRRAPRAAGEVRWDPRAADAGNPDLGGAEAVVHLAGASIDGHRWTASYKAELRASRVLATRALATALARLAPAPKVLLSASGIGWYGGTGDRTAIEETPPGDGFLARLAQDWEAAADPARQAGIRVAHMRNSFVLSPRGGVLARLLRPARFGLLPRFGDGTQGVSWISLTDEVRAVRFLLRAETASGPFNFAAPHPVTNDALTAALHRALHRPDPRWLRIPGPVLRLALGEMSSELLTSARVRPGRLTEAGFRFHYPTIDEALAAELAATQDWSLGLVP